MSMKAQLARFALVAGGLATAAYLVPRWPQEQAIVFDLGSSATKVRRLEASYRRVNDSEALGGFDLAFPDGSPRRVRHTLDLPNGEYLFEVRLGLTAGTNETQTSWAGRVTLRGAETSLFLGDRPP